MTDLQPIATALLTVTDKSGIVELAKGLLGHGIELISTGGTRAVLREAGLPVVDISDWTGQPEAFGGRMKTLSFQVGAGILFDRQRDAAQAEAMQVRAIDLVVCNLYAFAQHRDLGLPIDQLIEFVDIGGPTLIRAAAKNSAAVAVVTDPSDYSTLLDELERHHGHTSLQQRRQWMRQAFALTAEYDQAIADHLCGQPLRYGENPQQNAVFVPSRRGRSMEQLAGKALSYNNLVDLDAALSVVLPLSAPACVVVKHENPCGFAQGGALASLLERAWQGDPTSAFGSVVAVNFPMDTSDLSFLQLADKAKRKFVEVIAAPSFTAGALALLTNNANLRVITVTEATTAQPQQRRSLSLGTLVQTPDVEPDLKRQVVSQKVPGRLDQALIDFGVHVVKALKSNAIAIVRRHEGGLQLIGMGAGQPNRLQSVQLAVARAQANLALLAGASQADEPLQLRDCFLISDAFFPFADGPALALQAGIGTLVQPGGSIRDAEVVAACDAAQAVLVHTGIRHFRH